MSTDAHQEAVRSRRDGHRDARKLRRRRRHVLPLRARVEALSRVDPSVGVLVDVQNTLVINALLQWGTEEIKRRYLTKIAADTVGAFCLSEAGSGSDAFALTTRAVNRATATPSPAASCGSPTATKPTSSSCSPTSTPRRATAASRRSSSSAARPGFTVGKKEDKLGIRASSTCELIFEDCVVPESQILGDGRQGLQGRDRDAERRPHRHRRADARPRAGRARSHREVHQGAQAVRQADRGVPGRAVPVRAHGDRGRSDAAAGLQQRPPARCRRAVPHRSRDVQGLLVGSGRDAWRRWPSTCMAATGSSRITRSRSFIATPRSGRSTKARPTCS